MATKRQKKEKAKQRIRDVVPTFPIPKTAPPVLRALNLVTRGAEVGGQALVELDPLGIITDDPVIMPARDTSPRPIQGPELMMAMVNDPGFKLTSDQVDLINDDNRMVADTGMGLVEVPSSAVSRVASTPASFQQAFRSRVDLPGKRTRKKTKTDKNMSTALREANARLRTKNGRLRKGKTQADVMRLAHRLRRKM